MEYHFRENEWFSNKVLTMTYYVTCDVNLEDPWAFEGATISACQGYVTYLRGCFGITVFSTLLQLHLTMKALINFNLLLTLNF